MMTTLGSTLPTITHNIVCESSVNYIYHVVHDIPRTPLSYNHKLYLLPTFQPIPSPGTPCLWQPQILSLSL